MAKIYCRKIRNGSMSLDQVPLRWQAETEALLREEGGAK